MNDEIREKDHEWVKMFHSNIDRLLVSIEKLFESRQPSAFNDELLNDKEVAYILKVSRSTLQDYRNNGILSYIQVGAKFSTFDYIHCCKLRVLLNESALECKKCIFCNLVAGVLCYFCIKV